MAGSAESKKILCFINKKVGCECFSFLLKNFPRDDYYVVLGNQCNQAINLLKSCHISYVTQEKFNENIFPEIKFDWLLNLWGGVIFKKNFLGRFPNTLNIHPSYLPYCRGSDPAVWTIRCEFPAGVTLHCINDKVDEGAIWAQKQLSYEFIEKGGFLYEKLLHQCIEIFKEKWEDIRNLKISPREQVNTLKFRTNLRKNLLIDRVLKGSDTMTVKDFILRINAHDFSSDYTAVCDLEGKKYKITLNLEEIHE